MIDVVPLHQPNSEAMRLLEDALARVKSGETEGIAIVETKRGGVVSMGWSKTGHYHYLNSGVARLFHRLCGSED